MSKLLGKLLVKAGQCDFADERATCGCKYIVSSDSIEFRVASYGSSLGSRGRVFKVKVGVIEAALMCDNSEVGYKWSVGYKTKVKEDDPRELRKRELRFIGDALLTEEDVEFCGRGRKGLIISGWLNSDSEFDDLCCVMWLFKFSMCEIKRIKKEWKRKKWGRSDDAWYELEKRDMKSCSGRKRGSKNVDVIARENGSFWTEEDEERYQHNIKVCVKKRRLDLYLEAEKERCHALGVRFSRADCVAKWKEIS